MMTPVHELAIAIGELLDRSHQRSTRSRGITSMLGGLPPFASWQRHNPEVVADMRGLSAERSRRQLARWLSKMALSQARDFSSVRLQKAPMHSRAARNVSCAMSSPRDSTSDSLQRLAARSCQGPRQDSSVPEEAESSSWIVTSS